MQDNIVSFTKVQLSHSREKEVDFLFQGLMKKVNALEQAFMSPSPRASAIKRLLKER